MVDQVLIMVNLPGIIKKLQLQFRKNWFPRLSGTNEKEVSLHNNMVVVIVKVIITL